MHWIPQHTAEGSKHNTFPNKIHKIITLYITHTHIHTHTLTHTLTVTHTSMLASAAQCSVKETRNRQKRKEKFLVKFWKQVVNCSVGCWGEIRGAWTENEQRSKPFSFHLVPERVLPSEAGQGVREGVYIDRQDKTDHIENNWTCKLSRHTWCKTSSLTSTPKHHFFTFYRIICRNTQNELRKTQNI